MKNWGLKRNKYNANTSVAALTSSADYVVGTSDFTWEVCFIPNRTFHTAVPTSQSGFGLAFGSCGTKHFSGTITGFMITADPSNPGALMVQVSDGTTNHTYQPSVITGFKAGSNAYNLSNPIHVALVRKAHIIYMYIDGRFHGMGMATTTINSTSNSSALRIGNTYVGQAGTFLYARYSNVARSREWLSSHYQDKYFKDSNVTGLWNFSTENGTGSTAYDTSGSAKDMTVGGDASFILVPPVYEGFKSPQYNAEDFGSIAEASPSWFTVASWTAGSPSALQFTVTDASQNFYNAITAGTTRLRISGVITNFDGDVVATRSHSTGTTTITMTTTSISTPGGSGQEILKIA